MPKCLKRAAVVAAVGCLPLLLYILLGPRDGNPIGLGLLAALALIAAVLIVATGLVKWAYGYFCDHR